MNDELDALKRTVSDFQTAQLFIYQAILELLIERNVCSPEQAHAKFLSKTEETAQSEAGLTGAEIVVSVAELLEEKWPHLKANRKPS